jgi:glycosyltransferase involved in cell wall biosynthesis
MIFMSFCALSVPKGMTIIMKIIFLSNYFNHHQEPLSEELFSLSNGNYYFIETMPIEEERVKMGWGVKKLPIYLIQSYKSPQDLKVCENLVDSADVVIIGSAPESFIKNRLKNGKLIFRYHERPLKKGIELYKYPFRYFKWHKNNPKTANIYMLCASAYTAGDFAKFGLFKNKCLKWGYFTEAKCYADINHLIETKRKNSIIWVARFITYKHPEVACLIGEKLLKDGYEFEINMIGNGELLEPTRRVLEEKGLTNYVHILGSMKPEDVREHMEKSEIHIFTSDKNEGWGAVLNESMNSACIPISSHAIGSTPFLIDNGVNGFIYEDGNVDDLYSKIKLLFDKKDKMKKMSENAYKTIVDMWSPKNVAERFIKITELILNGEEIELFKEGPCSKAGIILDDWFINE